MGLFNRTKDTTAIENGIWQKIESEEDLQKAEKESFDHPVVIFKHSTRCPISRMVLKNFEKSIVDNQLSEVYHFYYLDLLKHRSISNEIEDRYRIVHESPQVLVIRNDECTISRSHTNILLNALPK